MLPLQTSLKTKKKKILKCNLMVLKVLLTLDGTVHVLIPLWLQKKTSNIQLDLNFGPRGSRPDAIPARVYCNVTFNLLY